MAFDIPTLLNGLGLVLTVLFFVIGYRQTIGARKERARAANKRIVDVLFRRLAHEDDFVISSNVIEKLLSGWALEARIRYSEIMSPEEMEAMLLARTLDNDYIAVEQRKSIVGRIQNMFKEEPSALIAEAEGAERSKQFERWFLVAGSALAALATSWTFATLFFDQTLLDQAQFKTLTAPLTIIVTVTAVAVGFYSSLRDASRSAPGGADTVHVSAISFERSFLNAAKGAIPDLTPSPYKMLDFTFSRDGKSFGVEVKADINRLGKTRVRSLAALMKDAATRMSLDKVFVVSSVRPRSDIVQLSDEKVEFVSASRFLMENGKPS